MAIYVYALCDICDERTDFGWPTKQELVADLRECGWSMGKRTLCPECKINN